MAPPIDPADPLYLHASDTPGMLLVAKPFDGTNYGSWRRGMLIALSAKNKIDFINGVCEKPKDDPPLLRQWERCNNMVISWLLKGLTVEISDSVIYSNSAMDIWEDLEQRYGQSNGAKLFQVQQNISLMAQGSSNISTYFTRIKKLWDELGALTIAVSCTCDKCDCGAKASSKKLHENQKLMQFLMGLNESYTATRGNILMMNPLPSISNAHSLLLQEEKQREMQNTTQLFGDSMSFNAGFQRPIQSQWSSQSQPKGGMSRGFDDAKKNNLTCGYCKKPGHTIDKCYKLHGFPQNFKFTKPRRTAATVQGESAHNDNDGTQVSSSNSSSVTNSSPMTQEQYHHLVSLLNNSQDQAKQTVGASSNFAGPFSEEATGCW